MHRPDRASHGSWLLYDLTFKRIGTPPHPSLHLFRRHIYGRDAPAGTVLPGNLGFTGEYKTRLNIRLRLISAKQGISDGYPTASGPMCVSSEVASRLKTRSPFMWVYGVWYVCHPIRSSHIGVLLLFYEPQHPSWPPSSARLHIFLTFQRMASFIRRRLPLSGMKP